jgi:uncharacterized delta-60 repeat protein
MNSTDFPRRGLVLLLAFLFGHGPALAVPGDLDLSFGRKGATITSFGSGDDRGQGIAVQSDGKIVVTGDVDGANNVDFGVARYLADGSLDSAFGTGGKVATDFGSGNDFAKAVAIQSDGKIVVVGVTFNIGNPRIGVVRYLSDGSLDPSFNTTGKVITALTSRDGANGVAIQSDGKIVVVGFATPTIANTDFVAVRYNSDGSLDTGFGTGGSVITPINSSNDEATGVVVQGDGKIVAVGKSYVGSFEDFAVVRYTSTGGLDPGWNTSGIVTTDVGGQNDEAYSVALQTDGKIVVCGTAYSGSDHDYAFVRYTTAGFVDGSFNSGGKVVLPMGGDQFAFAVTMQADQKIVAAGSTSTSGHADAGLLRLLANGTLDSSFGSTGLVTIPISGNNNHGNAVAVQGDGRIVLAGDASSGSNPFDFFVARRNADGSVDGTFGPSTGIVVTSVGSGDTLANSTVIQSDGKIVVAGTASNGIDNDFCVIRYNADGSLDPGFNGTGSVLTAVGTGDDAAKAVALQTDGKIVVAGFAGLGSFASFGVVRYNPDGSLDSSFNSIGTVTIMMGSGDAYAQGVVVQADGKIVVAGYSSDGSTTSFALARLLSDGTLDPSFNGTGKIITPVGGFNSGANSVALQGDGKIIAAGYASNGSNYDFAVLRYGTNGALDPTFNGTGVVTTPFDISDEFAFKVAVQADGKIVAAGYATLASAADFALARYQANGTLDPGFNNGAGKITASIGPADDIAYGLAIQDSDQKLVVTGTASNGNDSDFAVMRFKTDGTLDTTFHGTGKVTTPIGAGDDFSLSAAIQSDGKIVLAGSTVNGSTYEAALVRYLGDTPPIVTTEVATGIQPMQAVLSATVNPNGFDTQVSFLYGMDSGLADGVSTTPFNIGSGMSVLPENQVVTGLRPNTTYYFRVVASSPGGMAYGNILVFDTATSAPKITNQMATAIHATSANLSAMVDAYGEMTDGGFRYGTDPTLTSYMEVTSLNAGSGQGPVPIQKTIIGLTIGQTYYYRALASNPTGTSSGPILSFVTATVAGDATPDFVPGVDDGAVRAMAVQPDGAVVIGGAFTSIGGTPRAHLARLNSDGTLDMSFNPGADALVEAIAIQPDGKIVIGGTFGTVAGTSRSGIARLNGNGTLDSLNAPTAGDVTCLALQPDGKILFGGNISAVGGIPRNGIARLNADGALDMGFDPDVTSVSYPPVACIAVRSDGRIVLGGNFSAVGGQPRPHVALVNENGSINAGFSNGASDLVAALAVQPDGKVIVGGAFTSIAGAPRNRIARLDAVGAIDPTFDPNVDNSVNTLALQADGAILLGGSFQNVGGNPRSRIARVSKTGALDGGFDFGPEDEVLGLQIEADGRVLVGGYFSYVGAVQRPFLARLANGAASQALTVPSASRVEWLRSGTAPETQFVTFESSTDGGTNWSPLGFGARISGGWELTGLSLPIVGMVRARAFAPGGLFGGSSSIVQQVAPFAFGVVPTVSTQAADGITAQGATFHGTGNPNGLATMAFVEIGVDSGLADATPIAPAVDLGNGASPVPFSQPANLFPHTTYYYRAAATNAVGTGRGNILSFTTLDLPPTVTTLAADGIGPAFATLHATGTPFGLAATGHFEYGTDPLLADASATPDVSLGAGQTPVALDQPIGPLGAATTYYYRAVVTTAAGTSEGSILSFSTASPPVVGVIEAGPIVNPVNGHTYYLLSQDTWTSSEARARVLGGHLVTINDATENQWVYDTFDGATRSLWIGLTDLVKEGTFVWVNGQVVAFTNWNGGEPNDGLGGEDYAHLIGGSGGFWNDAGGAIMFHGVVEVPDAELVVDAGGGVPGQQGSTFFTFGSPTVDGGRVGGAAMVTTDGKKQTLIFGGIDGGVIASTGGDAPGNAIFTALGDPVFGGEGLAFTAVSRANAGQIPPFMFDTRFGAADFIRAATPRLGKPLAGLFSKISRGSSLRQAAVQGGMAPGAGTGRFSKLPTFGLPRNRPGVFFTGTLARGGGVNKTNDSGVWREKTTGDDSDLLLRTGDPIVAADAENGQTPNVTKLTLMVPVESATDQRRSFAPDGTVAATATFADKSSGLVIVDSDGTKSVPVTTRTDPGIANATIDRLDPPAVAHGGLFAFQAALRAAARGLPPPPSKVIFVSRDGIRERVAGTNDVLGDQTRERLRSVGQPLLGQSGLLAFLTTLQRVAGLPGEERPVPRFPVRKAIVQVRDGVKKVVIAVGDPAPECGEGVTLQRIQSVVVTDTPGGHIVFTGTITGKGLDKLSRQAMWSVSSSGVVKLLVRTNQSVVVNATGTQPKLRLFEALVAKPASKGQGRSTDEVGFVTARVKLVDGRVSRTGVLRIPLK